MLIQQFTTAMLLLFCGEGADMAKSSFSKLVFCVDLEVLPVLYK